MYRAWVAQGCEARAVGLSLKLSSALLRCGALAGGCLGNPCANLANSTGVCTDIGEEGRYSCGCVFRFFFDGEQCVRKSTHGCQKRKLCHRCPHTNGLQAQHNCCVFAMLDHPSYYVVPAYKCQSMQVIWAVQHDPDSVPVSITCHRCIPSSIQAMTTAPARACVTGRYHRYMMVLFCLLTCVRPSAGSDYG